MKAGLTGLAQVKGRNNISWDEKVTYDNEYIDLFERQGIWIDIKILFESVLKVFKKESIYENKAHSSMTDEEAAKFVNPDCQVTSSYAGSFDDVNTAISRNQKINFLGDFSFLLGILILYKNIMETSIKERITRYLKNKMVSQKTFCDNIGVSHGYVSAIKKSIAPDKLQRISHLYPDLNIDWLLTGEGDMLRDSKRDEVPAQSVLSGDVLAYLREKDRELRAKDDEIRELRARIDELTGELHEREIEIVELKKENHHVAKRADVAASSQKGG